MTESKRYYWLKLKESFFNSKEVKKLRKIAGGDTYTIIYLKMQLLSIKNGGMIKFDGTENDIIEQLSLELDEEQANIRMTLSFLAANKLIEQLSADEYLLSRVPELVGSETTAAERMRKMRSKKKLGEVGRHEVTPGRNIVTQREESREKRIEKREKKEQSVDYSAYFEEFWKRYPRKRDKKKCKDKFKSLLKSPRSAERVYKQIMSGLEYQLEWRKKAAQHNKKSKQKIFVAEWKNPLTWLRGECWNDEYEKIKEEKKSTLEKL